jgi:ankyrin repeat protein
MPVAVTSVSTDIKSDISASIGVLGKTKVAEIAIKTEAEAKNLFAKYPNVDKLVALQTMSATYCDMLKGTTAIREVEKIDRWERFQDKVLDLRARPSVAATKPAPEDARMQLAKLSLAYTPGDFVNSAEMGDLSAVKLFLAAGMDPNATTQASPNSTGRDVGQTALMAAAFKGHAKVVAALLDAGADINNTQSVHTPLRLAARQGHVEVVKILLGRKVDADQINRAFVDAAGYRRGEVVRLLLDKGADVKKVGTRAATFLLMRGGGRQNGDAQEDAQASEILELLLQLGTDPNGKDENGWSLLLAAAYGDFPTSVRLLLDRGAAVNAKCDCPNTGYGGSTALMLAVRRRSTQSVEALLAKGADVSLSDESGRSALTLSMDEEHGNEDGRRVFELVRRPATQGTR